MVRTPAGRTSSIKTLNKTFILQTEFLTKPRMRIVTSVALDGQVIHRVERTYDRKLETEDDVSASETAVVAQHQNLAKKIQTNGADFIKQTRSIRISPVDRLALIPGVSYVADIQEKLAEEKPLDLYIQSKYLGQLTDIITMSTKMGSLKSVAIIGEQGKFVLDKAAGRFFLLSLKPDVDINTVLAEAMKE